MSAYMDLNGVPASANRWLLTEVLRDELGFEGFVVSDANAVRSLETQHFAADQTDAAARALTAGLDMEMAMSDAAFANLPQAVEDGRVKESTLDAAVRRVLTAKFRLGLFEQPFADEETSASVLADSAHRDVASRAAERSIVLLKNTGTLPLAANELGKVVVIGQLADSKRDLLGPWVFGHDTSETVTILDGLRARLSGAEVGFAPGAGLAERLFPSQFDRADPTISATPGDWDGDRRRRTAPEPGGGESVQRHPRPPRAAARTTATSSRDRHARRGARRLRSAARSALG
jgi:beta-glucosidase